MRAALIAAAAGALLGSLAVGLAQQARINGLHDRLAAADLQAQVLQQVNSECAADVQAARDGWAEYRRQAAEREALAQAALADAESRAQAAQRRIEALASRPPAPGPECAAVDDLLREYLEDRK